MAGESFSGKAAWIPTRLWVAATEACLGIRGGLRDGVAGEDFKGDFSAGIFAGGGYRSRR